MDKVPILESLQFSKGDRFIKLVVSSVGPRSTGAKSTEERHMSETLGAEKARPFFIKKSCVFSVDSLLSAHSPHIPLLECYSTSPRPSLVLSLLLIPSVLMTVITLITIIIKYFFI